MALDSSPESPQPLRVVVGALKNWVERTSPIWVEGQIVQLKRRAGYGIHFLTLRDKVADVSVQVSVSTATLDAAGPITEGTLVAAWMRATVYASNGSLTFECRDLRPSGEGRLLAHLEQRKRALQAEGLFSPDRKRPLPFLPTAIGLITGKDSAAERDVVHNIARRWPGARVVVEHALMQGPHTVEQVMAGLRAFDANEAVEVIIIARGGGSMEDLLPFSDETLARAVFHCRTPVVSAIGHETDTPILDLVADVRASTPTDAAKRVVPDAQAEAQVIATGVSRLRGAITRRILSEQQSLDALRSRPVLRDPGGALALHAERLGDLTGRLRRGIERSLERERGDLGHMLMRVRALSPQATLQRGYAIVTTDDGRTVSSIEQVEPDEIIVARLIDGDIAAAVVDVEPHNHDPQQEES
ncbi:exodeoxyribonuclease VII large subunit [Propioniciclava flava]|uniref:Exodeoxyribonuclease 7 large subunit n=1 Tax=Propioniciclava flava TaxID=2072026 RepID=A0A4Q2EED5_9ACTN|nr:exodeoxyribonuclease VII large subunit [Propioniciclava flava]RXW31303.1 exodeoxyribonuclease VII large subunit [Propioniciclava flava]